MKSNSNKNEVKKTTLPDEMTAAQRQQTGVEGVWSGVETSITLVAELRLVAGVSGG